MAPSRNHLYLESYVNALQAIDALRDQVSALAFDELAAEDSELSTAAIKALGTKVRAARWLSNEIPALANRMPLFLASQGERELLLAELNAIRYGNWA